MSGSVCHLPHSLITGDAPFVGVLELPSRGNHRPPIRLFFPATLTDATITPKGADYLVDGRVRYILEGLSHIYLARHDTMLFRFVVRPFIWMVSLFVPVRTIPETVLVTDDSSVQYLPPSSLSLNKDENSKQRLVVFSHGLKGTGEENSVFCASLAKRGYVVASVHHRDGSSSRVPMPDGSCKFFQHFPNDEHYGTENRLDQVKVRAKEVLDTCDWFLKTNDESKRDREEQHPVLRKICVNLDQRNVIVAGFSYGAATGALAATMRPNQFQCAILLDGWFQKNSSEGLDTDFPPDAFVSDTNKIGLDIPSLFICSASFKELAKIYDPTCRLAKQISGNRSEMHVIPDTCHHNFVDIVFWTPKWLLTRFPKLFWIGTADALEVHESILSKSFQFIDKYFKDHMDTFH